MASSSSTLGRGLHQWEHEETELTRAPKQRHEWENDVDESRTSAEGIHESDGARND